MLTKAVALVALLAAACHAMSPRQPDSSLGAAPPPVVVERHLVAMGTTLTIAVSANTRATAIAALEAAVDAVQRTDDVLSSWRSNTELSRLNASPPESTMVLSPVLWNWLRDADRWRTTTAGAFDPNVGALLDAWDVRGVGRVPTRGERRRAVVLTNVRPVAVTGTERALTWPAPHGWLDAGAWGKGAALGEARDALEYHGIRRALLDFGGQVLAIGRPDSAPGWRIGIADPTDRSRTLRTLVVDDESVATSSQSERWVEVGDARYGHVLDPRDGMPVRPWGSMTVVAHDPLEADALSTALFVMGPEQGIAFAEARGVAALALVVRGGRIVVRATDALAPYVAHPLTEEVR